MAAAVKEYLVVKVVKVVKGETEQMEIMKHQETVQKVPKYQVVVMQQ